MDIRCSHKMHGILVSKGVLEVKCDSRLCGAGSGVVVLHQFDLETGSLIKTVRFKQPIEKVKKNGVS
jgi:hypothetical protein